MAATKVWHVPDVPESPGENGAVDVTGDGPVSFTDTRRSSQDLCPSYPSSNLSQSKRISQNLEDVIDLCELDEDERNHLERVLSREEEFNKFEDERKHRLETGLNRVEKSLPSTETGFCISCGSKLRALFNPAQQCSQCSKDVCKKCSRSFYRGQLILCRVCHLRDLYVGKSGNWFIGFFGGFDSTQTLKRSASDVLKDSLRRSFTNPKYNSMRTSNLKVEPPSGSGHFVGNRHVSFDPPNQIVESAAAQSSHKAKGLQEENRLNVDIDLKTPKMNQTYHPPDLERVDRHDNMTASPKIQVTSQDQLNGSLLSLDDQDGQNYSIQNGSQDTVTMSHEFQQKLKPPTTNSRLDKSGSSMSIKNSKMSMQSSNASLYSTNSESYNRGIPISGEIELSVTYFSQVKVLLIYISKCQDIANIDRGRKKPNPYVKMYILPDKTASGKRKTKTVNSCNEPKFDEKFSYELEESQLTARTLWVSVWHNQRLGVNTFLGEVHIPLEEVGQDDSLSWYTLNEKRFSDNSAFNNGDYPCPNIYRGDLVFAIMYCPPGTATGTELTPRDKSLKKDHNDGVLFLKMIQAKNLHGATKLVDAYVKIHVTPHKYQHGRKKTQVIRRNNSPEWNCTLDFHGVSPEALKSTSVELTVWHHGRLSANDFLGSIRLNTGTLASKNAAGNEVHMWTEMMSRPNEWIDGSLLLRPNRD